MSALTLVSHLLVLAWMLLRLHERRRTAAHRRKMDALLNKTRALLSPPPEDKP